VRQFSDKQLNKIMNSPEYFIPINYHTHTHTHTQHCFMETGAVATKVQHILPPVIKAGSQAQHILPPVIKAGSQAQPSAYYKHVDTISSLSSHRITSVTKISKQEIVQAYNSS